MMQSINFDACNNTPTPNARKHECSYFIGNIYLKSENVAEAEKSFREGQAYCALHLSTRQNSDPI